MSKILTRTYRARYSDINADQRLAPADYARYILDTAYHWSEGLGFGNDISDALGLYWIIVETEIQMIGSLHFLEEFDFTIWMLDWRRVRGTRAFVIKRKSDGTIIAQGVQQIACMDIQTKRPTSPPDELIRNFRLDAPQEIASQRFPRVSVLPKKSFTCQLRVAWPDLDNLDIVNNAVYIGYAEEAVTQLFAASGWPPAKLKEHGWARAVRRVHIQYYTPAVWGDALNISVSSLKLEFSGGSLYVAITRVSDGALIASCVLDWELAGRNREEAHLLPESLIHALKSTVID